MLQVPRQPIKLRRHSLQRQLLLIPPLWPSSQGLPTMELHHISPKRFWKELPLVSYTSSLRLLLLLFLRKTTQMSSITDLSLCAPVKVLLLLLQSYPCLDVCHLSSPRSQSVYWNNKIMYCCILCRFNNPEKCLGYLSLMLVFLFNANVAFLFFVVLIPISKPGYVSLDTNTMPSTLILCNHVNSCQNDRVGYMVFYTELQMVRSHPHRYKRWLIQFVIYMNKLCLFYIYCVYGQQKIH